MKVLVLDTIRARRMVRLLMNFRSLPRRGVKRRGGGSISPKDEFFGWTLRSVLPLQNTSTPDQYGFVLEPDTEAWIQSVIRRLEGTERQFFEKQMQNAQEFGPAWQLDGGLNEVDLQPEVQAPTQLEVRT